ncbi:hypothetical protein KI387_022333, partial [Taxus chinensis]
ADMQYSNEESLFMAQLKRNYGQGSLHPAGIFVYSLFLDLYISKLKSACLMKIVGQGVLTGVLQLLTKSPACFSARNAVLSVSVFLLELMETNKCAPATTTGRLNKGVPSALDFTYISNLLYDTHILITGGTRLVSDIS